MSITSYSFCQRSSSTGYSSYRLSVNGAEVSKGHLFVDAGDHAVKWTGDVPVDKVLEGLTGHITIVLTLSHASTPLNSQATFRMDDFVLNGTMTSATGGGTSTSQPVNIHKYAYRYGFNAMENDNDVKGKGNQLNFRKRIYDSRIERLLNVDLH